MKDGAYHRRPQWPSGSTPQVLLTLCALLFLLASANAQAPGASLLPVVRQQFDSPTGVPLAGGKIYTYAAGTSTPLATYTDATLTIQNTNPVILDSGGFATIFIGPSLYKICVADQNNVQQYCTDNVSEPTQLLFLGTTVLSPYVPGASCNNSTAVLGWDTFGTNAPFPFCVTGTNVQKGAMGMPGAYAHFQQNSGTSAAAGTITTTYPATTTAGSMLVVSVAFNATTTITGCTDGTNAYSQAKHVATGALSLDIWVFHNAASKTAGTTLTCTFTAPASGAIKWHEYLVPNVTSTDQTASNTGTGTPVTTGATAATAQSTELVFSAAGDLAAPSLVANSTGYADHGVVNNSTTVQVDDAGIIQQAISTQFTGFTLGTSQTWAAAVVTFKATNAGSVTAQRQIGLPASFLPTQSINSPIKWQNSEVVIGASNAVLGSAIACTADGSTDDPTFNAATTATVPASQTAANIITTTSLSALASAGCTASGLLHWQIQRLRYNPADVFEGLVYVDGASLTVQ